MAKETRTEPIRYVSVPTFHFHLVPCRVLKYADCLAAQALATPTRWCVATRTALPRFFLDRFRLVAHPEMGDPWWVAQGLEKKSDASQPPSTERAGQSAYLLSRRDLLEDVTSSGGSPYAKKYKALMGASVRPNSSTAQLLHKTIWRKDMDSWLLEIMRRRVVDGLLYFADKVENADRRYLIKCKTWDEAKEYNHRGCLLYFGEALVTNPISTPGSKPATMAGLPRLSTMSIETKQLNGKLAVHNMQDLLSEPHFHRLKAESSILRDGSLFLLGRAPTMELQLLLWKLQGYLSRSPATDESTEKAAAAS